MSRLITRAEVESNRDALPAFPRVISDLLATLDDPDVNLKLLVEHVSRDPVLAGRVFARANAAARQAWGKQTIQDLYAAASLIGLRGLREIVIMVSLAGFFADDTARRVAPAFWQHSVATGVCAQQLAIHARLPRDIGLISGLLHDVGQLWLHRFVPQAFASACEEAERQRIGIDAAERKQFGVDHACIGAWLAESWGLPASISLAIKSHHMPDEALHEPMVAVLHVAEVLSNALDLNDGESSRVTYLSSRACETLGLSWETSCNSLFGRIEAVSRHMTAYFQPAEPAQASSARIV